MTQKGPFNVNVSPEMQLYKVLQKLSYGEETALTEFIDNSVQAYLDKIDAIKVVDGKDSKLVVSIEIDTASNTITIIDNASGINRRDFQRAIRMGHKGMSPHLDSSMSVYGIGMKSAAVWFSNEWEIETSCISADEKLTLKFNLDNLLIAGSSKLKVNPSSELRDKHYTKITLKNQIREVNKDFYRNQVMPHLLETFNKFSNFLKINMYHDSELIFPEPKKVYLKIPETHKAPEVDKKGEPKNKKLVVWKKDLDFIYKDKRVYGFVLIRNIGSYQQPGIRLYRNKRVIEGTSFHKNRPNSLFGTSNKYASQRVYGELHLDDFDVNFMKTGFDDNLNSFYDELKRMLRPPEYEYDLLAQATNFRKKKYEDFLKQEENEDAEESVIESESDTNQEESTTVDDTGENQEEATAQDDSVAETGNDQEENTDNESGSRSPGPSTKMSKSKTLESKLTELGNHKLINLYRSLCIVSLVEHPILLYVGAWSFLESLSTHLGKNDGVAFDAFLNPKINLWYKTNRERGIKNDYKGAIKDILEKGNCNKHSGIRYAIDARQLENDFKVLTPFLVKLIDNHVILKKS